MEKLARVVKSSETWHQRFGYKSNKTPLHMEKNGSVIGLKLSKKDHQTYESGDFCKQMTNRYLSRNAFTR